MDKERSRDHRIMQDVEKDLGEYTPSQQEEIIVWMEQHRQAEAAQRAEDEEARRKLARKYSDFLYETRNLTSQELLVRFQRKWCEMDYEEISRKIGLKKGNVVTIDCRARKKIQNDKMQAASQHRQQRKKRKKR